MIVYKVTNVANGKSYIGITVRLLNKRWTQHKSDARKGSNSPLHAAIRKYGEDNFTIECIATAETIQELKQFEIDLILQHKTFDSSGYNATRGGDGAYGRIVTDENRANICEGLRRARADGRFLNDKWLANCRLARTKQIGIPHSDNHRLNISNSLKGRKKPSTAGKQSRQVDQFTITGEYITTYASYADAARAVNSNSSDIMRACQGKRKTIKGYRFNWADKSTKENE